MPESIRVPVRCRVGIPGKKQRRQWMIWWGRRIFGTKSIPFGCENQVRERMLRRRIAQALELLPKREHEVLQHRLAFILYDTRQLTRKQIAWSLYGDEVYQDLVKKLELRALRRFQKIRHPGILRVLHV